MDRAASTGRRCWSLLKLPSGGEPMHATDGRDAELAGSKGGSDVCIDCV
jgi:hypothetical protein